MTRPEVHAKVEALLLRRNEVAVSCELVMEIRSSRRRPPKERLAILARPNIGHDQAIEVAVLYVMSNEKSILRFIRMYDVATLSSMGQEGSSQLNLDFTTSPPVKWSFESGVQREAFVLELQRSARELGADLTASQIKVSGEGVGEGETGGDAARNDNDGFQVANNLTMLRYERHSTLAAAEVSQLLRRVQREGGALAFNDFGCVIRGMTKELQQAELEATRAIISSKASWEAMAHKVAELSESVSDIGDQIVRYARHLTMRKDSIRFLEHHNRLLHRRSDNISALCTTLSSLQQKLTLPYDRTVMGLQAIESDEKLVEYLGDSSRAAEVAAAMRHLNSILSDATLEVEFPIKAVHERRRYFLGARLGIMEKVRRFIVTSISLWSQRYLNDASRFSTSKRLVLRTHQELIKLITSISTVSVTFRATMPEAFITILRKYRVDMQRVYKKELFLFFKSIRQCIVRVGWKGAPSLGLNDNADGISAFQCKSNAASMRRSQGSITDSSSHSLSREDQKPCAFFEVPHLVMMGFSFHTQRAVQEAIRESEYEKELSGFSQLVSRLEGRRGLFRPDIAYGLALEAAVDLVLQETSFLQEHMGVTNSGECHASLNELLGIEETDLGDSHGGELEVELARLTRLIGKECDGLYLLPLLSMVESLMASDGAEKMSVLQPFLQRRHSELIFLVEAYEWEQAQSVLRSAQRYLSQRTVLLKSFSGLGPFLLRIEEAFGALTPSACNFHRVDIMADRLVTLLFEVLDQVSLVKAVTPLKYSGKALGELEAAAELGDAKALQRGFLMQYRHHAYICCLASTVPSNSHFSALLSAHEARSAGLRDHYEELYLTRTIFVRAMPEFAHFTTTASDLVESNSREELRHHRFFSVENVAGIIRRVRTDVTTGLSVSAQRIKRHLIRDLTDGDDHLFHRALLTATWKHYVHLVASKIALLEKILSWDQYAELKMPISSSEVSQIATTVEA